MSGLALRIIAMITMLIDHITAAFDLNQYGRLIGRIAFPIYGFLLAESCLKLRKDRGRLWRYLFRIILMALAAEYAHDMLFYGVFPYDGLQNQLVQFALIVLGFIISEQLSSPVLKVIDWLAVIALSDALSAGYYAVGTLYVLVCFWYLQKQDKWKQDTRLNVIYAVLGGLYIFLEAELMIRSFGWTRGLRKLPEYLLRDGINMGVFFAALFLPRYDGTYPKAHRAVTLLYRFFYPLHLWLLLAVKILMK